MTIYKFPSCYFEITAMCNLNCIHCYNDSGKKKCSNLNLKTIKKAIDGLKERGVKILSLSGGEPLLNPDFASIVNYSNDIGFDVHIATNGTLLDKLDSNILNKQISLDGASEKTHEKIRNTKGCFKKTINNILYLNKTYPQINEKLSLKLVINKLNKDELSNYIDLAKSLSIKDIRFSFMILTGRAEYNDEINLSCDEKIEIIKFINNEIPNHPSMNISTLGTTDICPYTKEKEEMTFGTRIDFNGDVFPCQSISDKKFCFGNIREESMSEILSNDKLSEFLCEMRDRQKHIYKCEKCVWKKQCNGGCVGTSFKNNNYYEIDADCLLRKKLYNNAIINEVKKEKCKNDV